MLLDCAYKNISGIGDIDVDASGPQSIATSLSKVYATGMNKIGIKFDRQ